jgi:nitrite reductase/ring-hydroxylating ferredoxin subunit
VYAVGDVCSHEQAFLSEGFCEGFEIECPLHGSIFDVRTGDVKSLPATEPIKTYPVKVEDGAILVDVEA